MIETARGVAIIGRMLRLAVVAVGVVAVAAGGAAAQQAKKGKAAPAAAKKEEAPQSAWVKLCEKAPITLRDKDGKPSTEARNVCLTHHERLDGNTGLVLVSAALRHVEGQDKQHLMVMVPLGMALPPGLRATVYTGDQWAKVQKNEKFDDSKLTPVTLKFSLCHPAGCTAEIEATPEIINSFKAGAGIMVLAINAQGQVVGFPVPLTGFKEALDGQPVDSKKYGEARRALMTQIAQRQQQLAEEHRKKQAEAAKGAPAAPAPAQKK